MTTDYRIDELVKRHQGLLRTVAITIAKSLAPRTDLEDLIAYGQIGLAEAAKDYDPAYGTQFSTYAYYRIRGSILDGACQMSWYNRAQIRKLHFQRLANAALSQQRQDGLAETDTLTSSSRAVARLIVVGLATDAGDEARTADRLEDHSAPRPEDHLLKDEACGILRQLIDQLPDDQRQLIRDAYFEGISLSSIAHQAGRSKSWASRVHDRALDSLARSLRRVGVAD